ncbi:MAG: guanylate kinase [Planctomycetota bacterium]|nr:guanylate kinase [Planctomycetota bacterium]
MAGEGKLVVITGPSGVGKSTIVREALARTGASFSVSATTRSPRPGEVEGVHYRFLDAEAFEKLVADGQMLEWANVFGQCYGTPAAPVREALAAGKTVILEIDVQGGLQVHARRPDGTFILIVPPNEAALAKRLAGRGTEAPDVMARRLAKAKDELIAASESGAYTHVVVNDDLEKAIARVVDIINKQE